MLLTEITKLAYEGLKKHDPGSRRRNNEEKPLILSQQQLLLCYGDIRPGRGPQKMKERKKERNESQTERYVTEHN